MNTPATTGVSQYNIIATDWIISQANQFLWSHPVYEGSCLDAGSRHPVLYQNVAVGASRCSIIWTLTGVSKIASSSVMFISV